MKKNTKQTQQTLTTFIKHTKIDKKQSDVNSDLSKVSNSKQSAQKDQKQSVESIIQKPQPMVNVQFYLNKRPSQPSGDYIIMIHKNWCENFDLLQRHHGFIQWLFPNQFTSRFNPRSHALSTEEEKIFRTNMTIAERYVYSYQMMLQFYGMKLKSKKTGEITQTRHFNYRERYRATLLTNFHNHMRITRILCSLTMIGFGRYAKQLSQFLHNQIHSEKGQLRGLAKYNVDKDWKDYQGYVETYEDLNVYLKEFSSNQKEQHEKELNQKLTKQSQKKDTLVVEKVIKEKKTSK